jgi:hypothetical protein
MKDRIIVILAMLAAVFFIGTIGSCSNAFQQKKARDKEMALRLDLEERVSKFQNQINKRDEAFEAEKLAHSTTSAALSEAQSTIEKLKSELKKVGKLKDTLEDDLKEALVEGEEAKSER